MSVQLQGALFAAIAGLCSGTWPLFMRQAGVGNQYMPLVFCIGAGLMALLFAGVWGVWSGYASVPTAAQVRWDMLVPAGVVGGTVLIGVAMMLSVSTSSTVGTNLLVLPLVQITVPAIYAMWMGGASLQNVTGIALAYAAVLTLAGPRWG